jgi:hypothetical protein
LFERAAREAHAADDGAAQLRSLLTDHLRRETAAWVAETRAALAELERATRQDLQSCLNRVDWEVVNAAAVRTERPERYPAALTEPLDGPASGHDESVARPVPGPGLSVPTAGTSSGPSSPVMTGAAVGAGLGVASWVLIGLNPFLSVAVAAGAGTAYALNARKTHAQRTLEEAEAYGREAIARTCRQLDEWLQRALHERSGEVERALVERLTALERWLAREAGRAELLVRDSATGIEAERLRLDEALGRARSGQG